MTGWPTVVLGRALPVRLTNSFLSPSLIVEEREKKDRVIDLGVCRCFPGHNRRVQAASERQ